MIVTKSSIREAMVKLNGFRTLAVDTETTGLRPYHGDHLFSIIIACRDEAFYFNFSTNDDVPEKNVLTPEDLLGLKVLFLEKQRTWCMHNAKFDLAMLAKQGIEVAGTVHCTKAMARVEYNDHNGYSLEDCAFRIGEAKDDSVEKYIDEHSLYEWEDIPGKKVRKKNKHYWKVPFTVMTAYGLTDARITLKLGHHQLQTFQENFDESVGKGVPSLLNVASNEKRLTKTVFRMERVGLRIDREYCVRGARHEADRSEKALAEFKRVTGVEFKASPKLFAELFAAEKDKWEYTPKKNPSFETEVLERFNHPAARLILDYREAKSKRDFYEGFLYHADHRGDVHPSWNPDDTRTGRFSSSNPNFQNLTAEAVLRCQSCGKGHDTIVSKCEKCGSDRLETPPFLIRRAIVPRPGFVFFMPDYVQMEYKMSLDYACRVVGHLTDLARRVNAGEDVHQAVADLVKAYSGIDIGRSHAKNVNFAKLYGAWIKKLAKMIGCSFEDAKKIWEAVAAVAPEMDKLSDAVKKTAEERGFIRNWLGRRSYFRDHADAYKALNTLIQGGCADVNKLFLNDADDYLRDKKSRLVATIHDENPLEIHESEILTVPKRIVELMEAAYPYQYVKLTASAEWSPTSLADKHKGYPA